MNFDKTLSGTDKWIYIQPPSGQSWTLIMGSVATDRLVPNAFFTVWTESPPYSPYRDPVTGEMRGCYTCVTLIRVDASQHTFFPVIGGYSDTLRGHSRPIAISYPNRLLIAVSPHGPLDAPVQVWARFIVHVAPIP